MNRGVVTVTTVRPRGAHSRTAGDNNFTATWSWRNEETSIADADPYDGWCDQA